ncbi:hypothetical protein L1987_78124 [Smallanthus sonchifolius]|uniref:Uncharacterized protein n=1 Tax=Smallanthus sonchifolius TaxID=185202 RepID=A0ACB8ZBK5_9ASTR|nr:hypothetical protein L1987_78124 [Smallanthus sonchifolius]
MESDDGSSDGGDDEGGNDGAEGSDSEATEPDSSDSDDAPSQIDALFNIEEGEIDYADDWDDDEDVVIEIPKGDGEGEYELEDGDIFEFPSFDAPLDTGSVEQASNVEASTEASPVDPEPVDPEAPKETDMPSTSSKGPAPVWQKTSIIDKHGATGMILAREARSGKFEMFKPQVPKRVKDKHAVHPVTKKHLKEIGIQASAM